MTPDMARKLAARLRGDGHVHVQAASGARDRPRRRRGVRDAERQAVTAEAFPYVWRVRTRHPERFGQRCRVLVRSAMNSALVEFKDGFQTVTSRNYLRKAKQEP
jgi:hypothetical protein